MGGQCAIIYSVRSKHRNEIVSCTAKCPVCDVVYHSTERKDLSRTFYSAYGSLEQEVLKRYSPLHVVDEIPDHIENNIFRTTGDTAVNKTMHSDRFADKMTREHKKVTYYEIFGRDHCDLGQEYSAKYEKAAIEKLL